MMTLMQVTPELSSGLQIAQLGAQAILAIGCVALWRAWASERAEVKRLNDARVDDLHEILKPKS